MYTNLVSFIVPCFNEAENIADLLASIQEEMKQEDYMYEVIFIDDGSTDGTLEEMERLSFVEEVVKYISLSRNFGKESCMLAGLHHAEGDAIILMDADLQHPPELVHELLHHYEHGYDQVIAKRNRKGDSWARSKVSSLYYKIVNKMVDVELEDGEGDFRLLSRKAVTSLLTLSEGIRFSKGLYSWIGHDSITITYENEQRQNGESKWSTGKLLNYGIDGVISFNHKPLRMCFYAGAVILLLALAYIGYMFVNTLINGIGVPGYFTVISAVLFLGGVQLVCLGIIGEYIGRIYYETKQRPHYLVKQSNILPKDEKQKTFMQ